MRKSLLGRLLAVSALVAACSVVATAWLAVQTTSGAIKQEQGQNLTADTRIYNTLLGYAAGHPRWDGVGATVRKLARQSGRRIALTTENHQPVADSADRKPAPALPPQVSAVVDPLSLDTTLAARSSTGNGDGTGTGTSADRIDPRAVGPFRLPASERGRLKGIAAHTVACLSGLGIASDAVEEPSGRPRIQAVGNDPDRTLGTRCDTEALDAPTPTEKKALTALNHLADACLRRQNREPVQLSLNLSWNSARAAAEPQRSGGVPPTTPPTPVAEPSVRNSDDDRAIASCVGTARREQLSSYVASPALLFIGDQGGSTVPGFNLSPANTARIAGVAALVLALTVGASVLAGARLVRPLHALTNAAQRMRDSGSSEPVDVTTDNEIGRLAATFNDMSAHRARLEEQRKAMVSDVAHELRTPLSNIRGWLEAAQDGLADPDPAFVSSLLEEAVQLQHIIDDLQDLSAADAGALRLHVEPVRIQELLGQVASAHQARAETAGVTLTVTGPPPEAPVPVLAADPVRLRQAVGNLVSNAVRHTPAGGQVTLRVRCGPPDPAACAEKPSAEKPSAGTACTEVLVEVADTGTGIPAASLPYVFDRFWRAEKSRNRRTGGSGLGLAIVRKLAEAHGGTVSAASTEGRGSVFTLRLPVHGPTAAADRDEPAGRTPGPAADTSSSPAP
ncbi:sensor histidine kinase [Streptomyces sp. NPDC059398]|uniref:sensor histidine kinase n=1 Tax=Streptomyces sp. NPDC059398 TaxID=3346820 RepID=UPI0036CFD516